MTNTLPDLKKACQDGIAFWQTMAEFAVIKTCPKTEITQNEVVLRLIARIEELEAEQTGTEDVFLTQASSIRRYREALERIEDLDPNKNTLHDAINIAYSAIPR